MPHRIDSNSTPEKTVSALASLADDDRYRLLFEQSPNPILVFHKQTLAFLAVNAAAVSQYGYSREEFSTLTLKDIRPPEDIPALLADLASPGFNEKPNRGIWRHRKRDGIIINVEVSCSNHLLIDGQHAVLALATDVTERLRGEAVLRESEARFRSLFENMLEGFAYCRMIFEQNRPHDFVYLETNKAFETLTGLRNVAGRRVTEAIPGIKESNPELFEIYGRVSMTGRPEVFEAYFKPLKAWLNISVYSPAQEYFVAVFENVTEKRGAEDQLRQAQKVEAVGQLAGGVAHDFNNILGAILMQVGLMRDYSGLTGEMIAALEELEDSANRAANLTHQLLLFSRRQIVQTKRLDLNRVVIDLLKMLRRILGEHIEIAFQKSAGPLWINADAGMMDQVIMNLCVNARDAMPKGGRLSIGTECVVVAEADRQIEGGRNAEKFVRLSVADTGCGISKENQTRIFEPFFTTKDTGKGTGLGLATVSGIVKQHHGWIEMDSEEDKGSIFRIFIPACDSEPQAAFNAMSGQAMGGHETILFVEDDESLRKVVVRGLRHRGYKVVVAVNGTDALNQWKQHEAEIGLLLTDMVMPGGMTGLDLAKQLFEMNSRLRVIVSSGYSVELNRLLNDPESWVTFLPKPYDVNSLAAAVRACLDRR